MPTPFHPVSRAILGASTFLSLLGASVWAEDQPAAPTLESVHIIGSREDAHQVAGSGSVIDATELARFEHTDIHRILASVPGVYLRDEDGYGLRPNISIRGTYADRSGKITLMEDGVLIAPAPYTASSAYYFPTTGRLSGVEVLKGAAAIENGPYTIGGAVNLLSTPIPLARSGSFKQELGSDNSYRVHATFGDSGENFGYLIEGYTQGTDGYADIAHSSRNTGFDKDDLLVKLRASSSHGAAVYQQLDVKLQYSEESSDQTYVGLTETDFSDAPNHRYGLTQRDNMGNHHSGLTLSHFADFGNGFSLSSTAYYNEFARNWYKVDKIDGEGIDEVILCANGLSCGGLTSAYGNYNPSLANAVLHGEAEADVYLKNNNRSYISKGLQTNAQLEIFSAEWQHEIRVGVRYHEDSESRQQPVDVYHQSADGTFGLASAGSAGRSSKSSHALSWHLVDTVTTGDWTLSPGVRVEDYTINGVANRETLFGLGVLRELGSNLQLLGGIYEGHSPSSSSASDPETALNYEFGARYDTGAGSAEVIGFYSDYDNIIGVCTNSGGAGIQQCDAGDTENGGAAVVRGIEAQWRSVWGGGGFSVPLEISYTYTDSEFKTSFYGKSVWGEVESGDRLPNIPQHQAALTTGIEADSGWGVNLAMSFASDACSTAACAPYEELDSYYTVDASGYYELNPQTRVYLNVANITDAHDRIVSREPKAGARGLRPRSYSIGLRYDF